MIDFLYYLVAFVVALGILIVVHEAGHFWVARRLGVKVLRFSVGFGKPLWVRRVGADRMELVVAALPLGGYVKMLDETEGTVDPTELPRAFNRQPVWKRIAIVLAGPMANFLFAVLAYWAVNIAGLDGLKPVVGRVLDASIAAEAGFREGDLLLQIDGRAVQSWDQHRLYLFRRALDRDRVSVEVRDRDGQAHTRVLDLSRFPVEQVNAGLVERGIGLFPALPSPLPVIGALEPGPAASAGLTVGDRFVAIEGQTVRTWDDVATVIGNHPGRALAVTVERDGARRQVTLTPDSVEQDGRTVGRIRIRPQFAELPADMRVQVQFGPGAALAEALESTWSTSWLTLEMLYRMLKLEVSAENISGPITIAQYAGHSAKIGLTPFVLFLAFISISLGVLNLLPIPVLDGGHLMYYSIEAVKGSPVSERSLAWGQQIGVALLVALMVLAFYNDLTRLFR
jgi:regulator of sigma E protease